MIAWQGLGADLSPEALSEALRRLEEEHDRRVEEMIRAYRSAPEAWDPGPAGRSPRDT